MADPFALLFDVFRRVSDGPPADLAGFLRDLPCASKLPSPWVTWTLNVLLQNGIPRLADFGVSRPLNAESPTGLPAGTPAFMAPEAFDGVRSVQTDIWSVGVMFHLLLTGSLPFPERDWSSLVKSILTRDPAPLPDDVSVRYRDVLRHSLAKDPARRFPSASEMATALKAAVEESGAPSNSVRLLVHTACFAGTLRYALFVNVTNLSEAADREVTHVWIETRPAIEVENDRRPLPKRLKPQETWETWVELGRLPRDLLTEELPTMVRVRLSTGEIVCGIWNESVPHSGWIPGEPAVGQADPGVGAMNPLPTPEKRPWWKFW